MNEDKANYIRARIKGMSRAEKWAEFKSYLQSSGATVNVDQIMADQATVGAPDASLDDALIKLAKMAATVGGGEPLTASELVTALENSRQRLGRGIITTEHRPPKKR